MKFMEQRDVCCWDEQQASPEYSPEFSPTSSSCLKGHRRSVTVDINGGGSICLSCFAALVSDPRSPAHHVSYAISQLSLAFEDQALLCEVRQRHGYLLVAPLVTALSVFNDEPLARQVMDLISNLCFRGETSKRFTASSSLSGDFIARFTDRIASGALAWNRPQIYMLHCFGELLNSHQGSSPAAHIREIGSLFSNLLLGLQLPSEELRGEVLFVIYKLCSLDITPWDDDEDDDNYVESMDVGAAATLLRFSLEILLKTQHDEVRMNCLALLLVLVRKGIFQNLFTHDLLSIDLEEARANVDGIVQKLPLITLFADAIKGSLLSSDEEIQSNTLNLIFNMLSLENYSVKLLRILVEENIPDYIFEVLRLSGNKDPVVISCLQVLALFAAAEEVFNQKLRVGFSTLLSVLHYTSQIPLHPVQAQALTLVCDCISNSPGIMSISQVTELASILTCILKRCINGELPETFILTCSTFIEILKSPSANGISKVVCMTKEASRCAVLSSLSSPQGNPTALIMYSLSFLKEAHAYSRRENGNGSSCKELEENIIATCQNCLLPWLERVVNEEVEEDAVHEVLQTFHMILLSGSEIQTQILADKLISSCWFTLCFTYLGLFPTDQMRSSIYLIFASLIDQTLGSNFGQPIRDAFLYLPLDPLDLIFLLGQKSSIDRQLAQCQRASLLLFYVSSLSGERLVDDAQVLASLEQYILLNSNTFYCGTGDSLILTQVVHLYGIFRGSKCSEMSYSSDAEKILLNLLVKEDMEMFSFDMHPVALKWLFQQEKITGYLLNQIMKFCRFSMEKESHLVVYSNGRQKMNMQMIPELVVSGDNYAAPLLVSLLRELRVGGEDDIMCVLKTMEGIVKKYSDASIRYCLCNFAGVIRAIYYSSYCSPQLFRGCSMLVFHVLRNANFHDAVSEEGDWLSVTMKLLEFINTKPASQLWGQEEHLAMSIFCLILHHSRNQVLEDAARAILLDAALASAVENIVQTACAKGPALVDHDEENETGECLTFVLLLYFFSLNSFYSSASQECLDWQGLLQCLKTAPPQLLFSIKCDDLCRLMHFGSPLLKALSSQCLAETLSRISDQRERNRQELRCPTKYLQAMIAIMENLVLYEEEIVATNCGICLSMILSWESLGLRERTVVGNCKWSRFIMEEFAMTLMAPGMASKYFKNQHKPASHIAAALLKLNETPEWMGSVFGASCMSGIISNLCPQKLSAEMVNLFRALLARKYLNESHIGCLNQAFQVCRKQVYKETSTKDKAQEILADKFISDYDDLNKICKLLIQLTVSPIYREKETEHQKLLKEIDLFYLELSAQNK